jgi:hypothetical protein
MELNYTIERDLREAAVMADMLVPYVYEDTLYAKTSSNMPSLTIGALLLRLRRLRALRDSLTDAQRDQWAKVEADHQDAQKEWREHYQNKLVHEAESRLNAMKPYFEECRENPRLCESAYLPEALRRTIVAEILLALASLNRPLTPLERQAQKIDLLLRGFVQPCDFIWDAALRGIYPPESYWWLYHRPTTQETAAE